MKDVVETAALRLYESTSSELPKRLKELELVVDFKRSQAAQGLADLLRKKLVMEGYLVISSIDEALEDYLEMIVDTVPREQLEIDLRQPIEDDGA